MKRLWPLLLVVVGFFLLLFGFIYDVLFAGIPYQDPTPEMSVRYSRHAHIASILRWCSVGFFLFAAVAGISRWVVRRQLTYLLKP